MMSHREENQTVTLTMTDFEPPMRTLRDRLAADGPFDAVSFSAKSDRWPEEVRVTARNKLWGLHFKCDSNALVDLFMRDHPHIFNHPTTEVRNIYRVGEVRDWLLARSDLTNGDPLELKLLCYCVFKTVQNIRHHAYTAEMLFRHK